MVYPVFDSSSLPFVEDMFARFKADRASVPAEWQAYFAGWLAAQPSGGEGGGEVSEGYVAKAVGVRRLIEAWRVRGHRLALINPLLTDQPAPVAELMLETYGLDQGDMDTSFATDGVLPGVMAPLVEIWAALQRVYSGTVGVESAPVTDAEQRRWVQAWWENPANHSPLPTDLRRKLYEGLVRANAFERFLHTKFVGAKRFSVEGTDAVLPLLAQLVELAGAEGAKHVVIGMAHRGRLNVLCNLMHKPLNELLAAFADKLTQEGGPSSGDVKYHLGKVYNHHLAAGGEIELNLLFNPSHLEAVNPVVLGLAKARQQGHGRNAFEAALPILMHGDSAVAGQGIVAECNNMMKLLPYDVGGTLHVVLNNQIGFTADPVDAFSGEYCTDGFRGYGMPIIHVNADDVEAAWKAIRFAYDYRKTFARDVVVDLVGYRRWGHNEGDDPSFTQPVMYRHIKDHPVAAEIYRARLVAEGALDETAAKIIEQTYTDELNKAFAEAQAGVTSKAKGEKPKTGKTSTAVSRGALDKVVKAWQATPPAGTTLNPKVQKVIDERVAMLKGEHPLNWGAAETAAYGTLLMEGIGWRLTGQDVQRGTFSHRHAVMTLTEDGKKWAPLAALATESKEGWSPKHEVYNSSLSENAVLGFEYGYALADSKTLVMWEGQFGDFANGAQVLIDQFLSAAEAKWGQQNHITVLLPHGFEGQGPEHSSARLERYLQLCAEDNMRVVVPSSPAQVFHLLRRQAMTAAQGGPRKPLIVLTPKSLLRNPAAVSPVSELTGGEFRPVIADTVDMKKAKRVVLCSGKIYYDLMARREQDGREDVAIIRVEELYPWPEKDIRAALEGMKARDISWVQEEPRNMGAWAHVREYWDTGLGYLHYIGRPASASPAAGTTARHAVEQAEIVAEVFGK